MTSHFTYNWSLQRQSSQFPHCNGKSVVTTKLTTIQTKYMPKHTQKKIEQTTDSWEKTQKLYEQAVVHLQAWLKWVCLWLSTTVVHN